MNLDVLEGSLLNVVRGLLPRLAAYSVTYVVLQIVTGIEVGVATAGLVVAAGWSMPTALSFMTAVGFPLLIIQGAFAVALHEGWLLPRLQRVISG